MTLLDWTLAALFWFAPPERHDGTPWAEPRERTHERYAHIAAAIVEVCETAKDKRGCVSLAAAIAIGESGLAADADEGPCYRKGGYAKRCDSGHAASVWQVQRWTHHTIEELFADRRLAARQALKVAYASLAKCGKVDKRDRLSGLSGRCIDGPGPWRARHALWLTIRGWEPPAKREPAT